MEFYYEGYIQGKKVKGSIEAQDKKKATLLLREKGVNPTLIRIKDDKKYFKFLSINRVSEEDLAFAFMQIFILLKSGIIFTKALDLVSSQVDNEELASAFIRIKSSVESGVSISDAFRQEKIFPEIVANMLNSAQTGENLEFIFKIVSEYLSNVSQIKSRITSALIYPIVVIIFGIISVFIATNFVVPKIASVLTNFGKDLPVITKAVLILSKIFTFIIFLSPVFIALFLVRDKFIKNTVYDRYLLNLPVIGKIILYFNISRFANILSITLKSSTPLPTAVNMAINSVSNSYIRSKIDEVKNELLKGKSLTYVLSKSGVFPPLFINLLKTGEESSKLEEMLDTIYSLYTKQIEKIIDRWVKLIEPITMVIIGGVIAIIVLSVILPMTELSTGIKK